MKKQSVSQPQSLREEILKNVERVCSSKRGSASKAILEPEDKKPAFWSKLLNSNTKNYPSPLSMTEADTSSWLYAHELGRLHLEEVFPEKVETDVISEMWNGQRQMEIKSYLRQHRS